MKIQNAPQTAMARPPREHWATGENAKMVDFQTDKLVSTADLLKQTQDVPEAGTPAVYTYQRDCSLMKPATAREYALGALAGAGTGAAIGAVGAVALGVVGTIFAVFTAGFFGGPPGVNLLAPAAIGGLIGAGVGASSVRSAHQDYPHYGESLGGTLRTEYGPDGQKHLQFHPHGQLERKVDLEKFSTAPTIVDGGEPGTEGTQWWQEGYSNIEY